MLKQQTEHFLWAQFKL